MRKSGRAGKGPPIGWNRSGAKQSSWDVNKSTQTPKPIIPAALLPLRSAPHLQNEANTPISLPDSKAVRIKDRTVQALI